MKIALPNGILLDSEGRWSSDLQDYARDKGLDEVRVFAATHPDGTESYVVVEGEAAVFESQQFEAIAVHLDIMWADRSMPR